MLARHPSRVKIVDLTTLPRMPHEADVILFDTFSRLPIDDEKLRATARENTAKVVVYSWDDYPEADARKNGAVAYLQKSLGSDALVSAIVAIHNGEAWDVVDDDGGPIRTWPGQELGLSEREAEMLTFITRGLTNEEIARRSYLTINTVKTYVRSAYRKIGVDSRAKAVGWGFRNGFQSTGDIGV